MLSILVKGNPKWFFLLILEYLRSLISSKKLFFSFFNISGAKHVGLYLLVKSKYFPISLR